MSDIQKSNSSSLRAKHKLLSDAQLVQEYRSGNQYAFNELEKRYNDKMAKYIFTIIHDEDDAKDVLQDAWVIVLESITKGSYGEEQRFDSWFKSVCYRLARQWNLDKQRSVHGDENMPDNPDKSFNMEQHLINTETEELLHKAISRLEGEERQLVILRAWEERRFHEIAVILNMKISTVRSTYCRIAQKMRIATGKG